MKFKIVILGDWGVGKTSLVRAFVEKKFSEDYLPSIGVNIFVKDIQLNSGENSLKITLALWDIAGHQIFKNMLPAYHTGAKGVLYVADLTREESFENLAKWQYDLQMHVSEQLPAVLFANKEDLEHNLEGDYIREVAERISAVKYFKTSAKTGANVQEAFNTLIEKILKQNAQSKHDKQE